MGNRTNIKDLKEKAGEEVTLAGWVKVRRDHGKLIFIDLRDATGTVQMVALPTHTEAHKVADTLRSEWVIKVTGVVNKRPEKNVNPDEENGDIEVEITALTVVSQSDTPPFDLTGDGREIGEEHRLEYRYLDLRRDRMKQNLTARHNVIKFIRDYLSTRNFTEIETPILTKSTPEGARDYIVPSRLERGKFYALPQSPQQYKQLLMVAGVERYFQIARCLRDEDTRGDRQAEFTQLDVELSFTTEGEVISLIENMYSELVKTLYSQKKMSWTRLTHSEAMSKYSTDKPDLRKDKNDPNELAFVWVNDFPLFENGQPSHHMFTAPREEDIPKLESDPASVRSYQYDLALNGYEIAGGSIRIHDPKIQEKVFDIIGFSNEQKDYFKHMLTAFRYGVPPHGGIASGLDRLLMILQNEPSIREVIAFPKTGEGRDLMMGAPSDVDPKQLKELGIKLEM